MAADCVLEKERERKRERESEINSEGARKFYKFPMEELCTLYVPERFRSINLGLFFF